MEKNLILKRSGNKVVKHEIATQNVTTEGNQIFQIQPHFCGIQSPLERAVEDTLSLVCLDTEMLTGGGLRLRLGASGLGLHFC